MLPADHRSAGPEPGPFYRARSGLGYRAHQASERRGLKEAMVRRINEEIELSLHCSPFRRTQSLALQPGARGGHCPRWPEGCSQRNRQNRDPFRERRERSTSRPRIREPLRLRPPFEKEIILSLSSQKYHDFYPVLTCQMEQISKFRAKLARRPKNM